MDIQIIATGSKGNCYRVNDLLIEAGLPINQIKKALNFKLSGIKACLCSHSHMDHAKGARDIMATGIDLYCHEETALALGLSGHRLHTIEPMKQFKVGDWKIVPFELVHDVMNMGFLISKGSEKLLYACDTSFIPNRFRDLSFVMLGVNYDSEILKNNVICGHLNLEAGKRTLKNHMSLNTAKGFFKANDMGKVNEIYLLHLSDGNSDEKKFKKTIEEITGRPVYTT